MHEYYEYYECYERYKNSGRKNIAEQNNNLAIEHIFLICYLQNFKQYITKIEFKNVGFLNHTFGVNSKYLCVIKNM